MGCVISSKDINIEAEQIEVVKKWPESMSVYDIQVFLGFANFYWQLIQGFSRITAPLTLMLKTTNEPTPSKNNGSRLASSKNNDKKPVSGRIDNDNEVDEFGDGSMEYAKKKRKSKGKNLSKSHKLAKSGKNLSKSRNLINFDATKSEPSFLTPKARSAFNCL